jgi:Lrp/AsnC family transcriptional regulator, leucine-responsive regulatory protein
MKWPNYSYNHANWMNLMGLDSIDVALLNALQDDSRTSYAELGVRVGLSVSGVNARLKKLLAAGYVRAYSAQLDPDNVGLGICAFMQVVIDRPEHDTPFLEAITRIPAVLGCHHITGEFSYLLKIRVRDTAALERVITEDIKRLPGVVRSHTVIALSSPK